MVLGKKNWHYSKKNNNSLLANIFSENRDKKEQKEIFKIISNGEDYITANTFKKFDTDNNGVLSEEEINKILELANA